MRISILPTSMYACLLCGVSPEARSGCQSSWIWSDRWLGAAMWLLGANPGSSG